MKNNIAFTKKKKTLYQINTESTLKLNFRNKFPQKIKENNINNQGKWFKVVAV